MVKPDFEPKTIHSAGFLLMLEGQNQRIKFIIGSKVQENFGTICHTEVCLTFSRLRVLRSNLKSFEPKELKRPQ